MRSNRHRLRTEAGTTDGETPTRYHVQMATLNESRKPPARSFPNSHNSLGKADQTAPAGTKDRHKGWPENEQKRPEIHGIGGIHRNPQSTK